MTGEQQVARMREIALEMERFVTEINRFSLSSEHVENFISRAAAELHSWSVDVGRKHLR